MNFYLNGMTFECNIC